MAEGTVPSGSLTTPCIANLAVSEQQSPPKTDPWTHYCLTRNDLPPGTQAAQLIHAAGESSPGDLPPHTHAIALTCKDERELEDISFLLFQAGVRHTRIIEDDPPYTGQLMAIGIPPQRRSQLKRLLSRQPLLR